MSKKDKFIETDSRGNKNWLQVDIKEVWNYSNTGLL